MGHKNELLEAMRHPDFWIFSSFFVAGTVTLAIKKRNEPISFYQFIGEMVLAFGMAFICWIFGLYNDLTAGQMVMFALPTAYGQVQMLLRLTQAKRGLLSEK